jgi:3-hydroxybutyryl-CoA dehydrogenase
LHSGTDEDVIEAVETLVPVTGKLTARVRDKAGFVLNRLQYVLLKEAINLVEEGVATLEDVDTIVRTTFGYRLPFFGPFAIADMAGLDVYRDGFRTLQQHYGERLAAPKMLTELVSAGTAGSNKAAASPHLAIRHRWSPTATCLPGWGGCSRNSALSGESRYTPEGTRQ